MLGNYEADVLKPHSAENSVDGMADDITSSGLKGNFNQLRKLKKEFPLLKILISIGGWDWSDRFSDVALTAESRKKFIASCINLYLLGNIDEKLNIADIFDGIDLDWEYPAVEGATKNYRAQDTQNFTALLAEFREALNVTSQKTQKQYLMTIAAPSTQDKISKIELSKIHPYLDFINVMTYDFHGGWENRTNFHSALFGSSTNPVYSYQSWTDGAIQTYLNSAVPAKKLVMGIAYFGRGWQGVEPTNNGLWQGAKGSAVGSHGDGVSSYRALKAEEWQYEKFRDDVTQGTWIFNRTTGVFWSYDDPIAIARKTYYMLSRDLAGVMIWELSADDASANLTKTIAQALK
jgi:chitinase